MHSEVLSYQADGLRVESHLPVDSSGRGRRPDVHAFSGGFRGGTN